MNTRIRKLLAFLLAVAMTACISCSIAEEKDEEEPLLHLLPGKPLETEAFIINSDRTVEYEEKHDGSFYELDVHFDSGVNIIFITWFLPLRPLSNWIGGDTLEQFVNFLTPNSKNYPDREEVSYLELTIGGKKCFAVNSKWPDSYSCWVYTTDPWIDISFVSKDESGIESQIQWLDSVLTWKDI